MRPLHEWFRRAESVLPRPEDVSRLDPQRDETRRELTSLAVRDTLRKHGIPAHWINAETHSTLGASRVRGIHLRLVVREWEPRLLAYTIALQRAIQARLIRLDPLSTAWMTGISWKFDVVDDGTCPALPPARYWETVRESPIRPLAARTLLDRLVDSAGGPSTEPSEDASDFRPTEPMANC